MSQGDQDVAETPIVSKGLMLMHQDGAHIVFLRGISRFLRVFGA